MDARAVAELQREADRWVAWEEEERAKEEEWKRAVLEEIDVEVIKDSVVGRNFKAVRFVSTSAGRDEKGRRRKRRPRTVTLVCYPKLGARWYSVDLSADLDSWPFPLDDVVTEVFGDQIHVLTRRPEFYLIDCIKSLLVAGKGRF